MDSLDGMRTFVAVVETGSFTAAGKRLGISNKVASKYIAILEDQMKVNLLHRTTRSLSLTNEGRTYLQGCRKVLAAMDALALDMDPSGGLSGVLKISAPLALGETVVAQTALKFMEQYPDVVVHLEMSDHIVDLAEGGYDLAIRMGALKDSSLVARKLTTTDFLAVASPEYLARYGEPLHPADLADHSCVRDINAPDLNRWPFFVEGQLIHVPVSGAYLANSPEACLAPVFAGKGIYHCPEIFLADACETGRLVQVLAGFRSLALDIHAVQLPSAYRNPKVAAFIELLRHDIRHWAKAIHEKSAHMPNGVGHK